MDLEFYVDIEDASGNKLGSGPIANVIDWTSTKRLSRVGEFRMRMIASDDQIDSIENKRIMRCKAITESGLIEIGAGIIDTISTIPRTDGNVILEVSGDDLLRELTYRSVLFASLDDGAGGGVTHASAVSTLLALAPSGWTFTADASPSNDDIYFQFAGESVLSAIIKLADLTAGHFYLSGDRGVIFDDTWTDSGIRAIDVPDNPDASDADTCYLSNLHFSDDSSDLISRIIPYGAGSGSDAITMSNATRTATTGYTLDKTNNTIINDVSEADPDIGRIERVKQFREVEKVGVTAADDISASNALYDIAFRDLQNNESIARNYRISVTNCAEILRPMQQIHVDSQRFIDGKKVVDVNELLNIVESTVTIDNRGGLRTTSLEVSTVQRVPRRDTDEIVTLVLNNTLRV